MAGEVADVHFSNAIPWIVDESSGSGRLKLDLEWDDDQAVVHLTVPGASQAAPGVAHGGFLATLADHVMGFAAAQHVGGPVVTRQMTVEYLAPTPTSRPITIRAQPDSMDERRIAVTLDAADDDSGRVRFRARGEYALVSPTRRARSQAAVDYATLEERFDPAQVFGWLTAVLQQTYLPRVVGQSVLLAVELSDARPQFWTFKATDQALEVAAGAPASWDVRYAGTVRAWRELVHRVKTADELVAAGSATVEDPDGLLARFLAAVEGLAASS